MHEEPQYGKNSGPTAVAWRSQRAEENSEFQPGFPPAARVSSFKQDQGRVRQRLGESPLAGATDMSENAF